jgi:hypothetical protein
MLAEHSQLHARQTSVRVSPSLVLAQHDHTVIMAFYLYARLRITCRQRAPELQRGGAQRRREHCIRTAHPKDRHAHQESEPYDTHAFQCQTCTSVTATRVGVTIYETFDREGDGATGRAEHYIILHVHRCIEVVRGYTVECTPTGRAGTCGAKCPGCVVERLQKTHRSTYLRNDAHIEMMSGWKFG